MHEICLETLFLTSCVSFNVHTHKGRSRAGEREGAYFDCLFGLGAYQGKGNGANHNLDLPLPMHIGKG